MSVGIPSQEEADFNNPEEHFLWALRNMPSMAGTGMVTHPGFLRKWSKHLVETGAVHVDHLRKLADENGNIHVSKLPKQTIKFQQAFRGPSHIYNHAARWVGKDTPDPEPMRLQDVTKLTIQEQHVMAQQLINEGVIRVNPPNLPLGAELNNG
jgi:hypothetical protein